MIRVLLVDDQPPIHTGSETILETELGIGVAGETSDGTQDVELAPELHSDVVCTDVQMPWMNGIEATHELTSRGCGSTVLILTTFDRDDFLFETLQMGASGFLLKAVEAEKLTEVVQTLGRGEGSLSPQVARRVIERFTAPRQEPHCPGRVAVGVLTEREHDTLLYLARGLGSAEIAAEMFVSPEAVKTHVSNILTKLGLRGCIDVVIWAYENGLVPRSSWPALTSEWVESKPGHDRARGTLVLWSSVCAVAQACDHKTSVPSGG